MAFLDFVIDVVVVVDGRGIGREGTSGDGGLVFVVVVRFLVGGW